MSFLRFCTKATISPFAVSGELRQGRARVIKKHVPVTLADAHSAVGQQHVAPPVIDRPSGARAKVINQKL